MFKKKLAGFTASVITAIILLTPVVASANTNGKYIAYINSVTPGYFVTTINVTYAGDSDRLYEGDGDILNLNTTWISRTNENESCHYATGNWTATLRSYDTTGLNMASDSKSFYNQ